MEALINSIALSAGRLLLNPFVLATVAIGTLAIVTGLAARAALLVENLRAGRRERR